MYDNLMKDADHVFILYGDNSDKENSEIRRKLKEVPAKESLILVATGQKIGEGFDYPRLDTLMLAAPVSFAGRLEQYIGRLNRDYAGKTEVIVYDYIDSHIRYFDNMYAKRLRTYKRTGFSLISNHAFPKQTVNAIYDSGNYLDVCQSLITQMAESGIHVIVKEEVAEHFAIFDDDLVWHGGMNLSGKEDAWDNLMRIKSSQVAAELLEIALGDTNGHEET